MRQGTISIVLVVSILILPGVALARGGHGEYTGPSGTGSNPSSHFVNGYTTRRGTYVPPHHTTDPNTTQRDNYGTRGNLNPWTGSVGTRSPRY